MRKNDKPYPMPTLKPGKGDEKPGAIIKPMPARPGIKPPAPRPVGNSGATTKPMLKPPSPQAVTNEARAKAVAEKLNVIRKQQASR